MGLQVKGTVYSRVESSPGASFDVAFVFRPLPSAPQCMYRR